MTGCTACQWKPARVENAPLACFYFQDCMYRNAENKDKSICMDYAKECRATLRMNKCMSIGSEIIEFRNCMLLLNQK